MIFAWKNIEQEVSGAVKDLGNWCQLFTGHEINFFFQIATWLLNSKWKPIQKKLVTIFKDKQNLFYAVNVLERPFKIKLEKRSLTCCEVDTRMEDIQCSGSPRSKMASMYQLRCKNLVTLAPVLSTIWHPGLLPGPYKNTLAYAQFWMHFKQSLYFP